jgi:hypothetical protein
LKFIAKATLNAVGAGMAGDFAIDVLPDLANDVWKWWSKDRSEDKMREEEAAIAQLTEDEVKEVAESLVQKEGSDQPEIERRAVANYLALVPSAIRQSQRGRGKSVRGPDHLRDFLPDRAPIQALILSVLPSNPEEALPPAKIKTRLGWPTNPNQATKDKKYRTIHKTLQGMKEKGLIDFIDKGGGRYGHSYYYYRI